ncbi:MAG: amidohydrolase family protein [Candidatus Aminicenantes bacterium]|nr:amidohydrolase family protein [Candidatus Aminicenantes bacterium]
MKRWTVLVLAAFLGGGGASAQGPDSPVIAIRGARIIPVVGEDIPEGTILVRDGRIEALGKDVVLPSGVEIIEAKGLLAYPGLIDAYAFLGLQEITGVAATVDHRETGRFNPQVRTIEALRFDSMHIPIARSNGITAALVVPSGGIVSGRSALINLDGRNQRDMAVKPAAFLHVELPALRSGRVGAMGTRGGGEAPPADAGRILAEVRDLLNKARFYEKRRAFASKNTLLPKPMYDDTLGPLADVARGELPLMISVHSEKDIKTAIQFVAEEKLKAVFYGVEQGWKVAGELKEAGIPCVIGSLYDMPPVWEDGYDALFRNPGLLVKAGVRVAFSSSSATAAKDLPYHAAKAAAFGLDKRDALKAVTIDAAEILGVGGLMGSLEKGKMANIVLADNDILEPRTNVVHVFIAGRPVDLSNRYTELLDKFKKKGS